MGGTRSSGNWCTVGVAGLYWMSSKTSVRATTAPRCHREIRADLERVGCHHRRDARGRGHIGDEGTGTPQTTLSPPVSMNAFHAAGLRIGLLLGADAARRLVSDELQARISRQSSSALSQQPLGGLPDRR